MSSAVQIFNPAEWGKHWTVNLIDTGIVQAAKYLAADS